MISSPFKRDMARSWPINIGIVSFPTIRSPCISRMSKKAVRTKTVHADHKNTDTTMISMVPFTDKYGNRVVTMPQAIVISNVFEPGISLILEYLSSEKRFGTSLKLYESPIILMIRRIRNGIRPMANAVSRPAPPADKARTASRTSLFL